nr:MAG TPA: hypothetical protein [Caudoviricetes sp.]
MSGELVRLEEQIHQPVTQPDKSSRNSGFCQQSEKPEHATWNLLAIPR